jgi:hypothetical protein
MACAVAAALVVTQSEAYASSGSADDLTKTVKWDIPADVTPVSYLILDESGKPVTLRSARIETDAAKRLLVGEVASDVRIMGTCTSWASPEPQLHPNNALSFGYHATCTDPIQVRVQVTLFSGPVGFVHTYQGASPLPIGNWNYGTGWTSTNAIGLCVDRSATLQWKMLMYAQCAPYGVWQQFTPYPGSVTRSLQCVDMV